MKLVWKFQFKLLTGFIIHNSSLPRAFITLILLLGAILIGVFYLRPEWKRFQELRVSTERLQQLSSEFDELIKNRDAFVDLINTVSKTDLDNIDKALPKGSQAGEVLVTLENLVGRHGIILQSIGLTAGREPATKISSSPSIGSASVVSTAVPASAIKEFPVDLNLTGSYDSIKNFLSEIEKNLRITDVTSLSFGSMKDASEKIGFSLRVKMYYQ